jgi:hypothetical protein
VGFDDAGRPLVARLSLDGTALLRIEHPEPPMLLRQLSDEIAREWRLSPDGSALVYAVPTIEREQVLWRPRALRTNDGEALPLELPSATYLSPLWEPTNGALTAGSLGGANADGVLVLRPDGAIAALEAASSGFDVPIAWSADGGWLAARHFEGTSIVEPGREAITVIGLDGTRRTIDLSREVIVIGWFGA